MTAIDCAPAMAPVCTQVAGQAAATQLEPGLERRVALVVPGLLGGGGESPATLR